MLHIEINDEKNCNNYTCSVIFLQNMKKFYMKMVNDKFNHKTVLKILKYLSRFLIENMKNLNRKK